MTLNVDGPTRFCSLPDDVLHSIIGLLPLEEAVRSCVLSRRWQHLPTTMPVLRFVQNHEHWRDRDHFINSVDKVCTLHESSCPIQKFVLSCCVLRDGHIINSWITTAIRSRAQVLSLNLCSFAREDGPYVLPQCIFRSETLAELRLNLHLHLLDLPDAATISLPNLKTLRLIAVRLVSGETIQNLLSASPLLETLSLTGCVWNDYAVSNCISSSCMRVLEIIANDHVDHYDLPPLRIECPSLEKLCYTGNLQNEVFVDGPTEKLDTAEIDLQCVKTVPPIPFPLDNVVNLLHTADGVKRLTFLGDSKKGFNGEQLKELVPLFDNLVELELSLSRSRGARTILRRCPCLERIVLMMGGHASEPIFWTDDEEDDNDNDNNDEDENEDEDEDEAAQEHEPTHGTLQLEAMPLCFQTHLKKITLTNFYGSDGDMEFAMMLLQNCAVLEEMVVEISRWNVDQVLLDKLKTLPKASQTCRITSNVISEATSSYVSVAHL